MFLVWLALGCAQQKPAVDPPAQWGAWRWGDVVIAVEERRDGEQQRTRRVQQRFLVGDRVEDFAIHSVAALGPDGSVLDMEVSDRWGRRRWEGRAWLPEDLAGRDGVWTVLDPWSLETRDVVVEGGRWTLAGLPWEALPGGSLRVGPVVYSVEEAQPDLEPVDPVALLARPAPDVPRPPVYARFQVDGWVRDVRAPHPQELPRDLRKRLQGLVDTTRSRVRWTPTAPRGDGWAALARGSGDCEAQAAALVALAEEQGLQGQVVHGLVWQKGRLVPHAWATLTWEGGAVAVDPALGQPIADATHLPLDLLEVLTAQVELVEAR